jgi:uncharacterized protein YkwD
MSFNWVDLILVLIVVLSAAAGWQRGFILSFLDLVRWIGSWLAGLVAYKWVAGWLGAVTDWSETWRNPVAFMIVVVAAGILIQLLGRLLLRRIPRDIHLRPTNRLLGTLPGLANGFVMAAIVSGLLFAIPVSDGLSQRVQESPLANNFAVYADKIENALAPVFDPAIRQTFNRVTTIEPGSNELVKLPYKVEHTQPLPSLEAQMLDMVNHERTSRGLKPLKADPELTEVARQHSADMFSRGYFSHYTPEGIDPFQRMQAADVRYRTAGENLALAPTLQIAHTGLMNSPGHRANILNPNFGRVGIGIMDGGRRGIMVSQEFRN